jgi:hypothetical protein
VPPISQKAFNYRQVPQMKLIGSNFLLMWPTSVRPATDDDSLGVPRKPTHVAIKPVEVFANPEAQASGQKLEAGTLIKAVRTEQGWVLVAKDGRIVGCVVATALAPIH